MTKLSAELLAVLRCPVTGTALVQEGDELVSIGKAASGRRLRYALDEGIPVLLPGQANPDAGEAGNDAGAS
jgi:uncharacterized protein